MGKHTCFGAHPARALRRALLGLVVSCAVASCLGTESENPEGGPGNGGAAADGTGGYGGGVPLSDGGPSFGGMLPGTGGVSTGGVSTGGIMIAGGSGGMAITGGAAGDSGGGEGGQPEAGQGGSGGEPLSAGSAGQPTAGTAGQAGESGSAGAAGGPIAITGVVSYESNPCLTDPCLPGMAAYVTEGSDRYVLRVQGRMPSSDSDWGSWDGHIPQAGETVTAFGYLTPTQDIFGSTVMILEVVQLTAA